MNILVCTDGQAHSKAAMQEAVRLCLCLPAEVTALHVIDPWLKTFYNELYAQGRRRYLEYVDECLQREAGQARLEFEALCREQQVEARFRVRYGEPLLEILDEIEQAAPDLVIAGCKPLTAWGRFRSRNLPGRLQKKARRPVSLISATNKPTSAPVRPCS
jgi:nucleotide-binding universal stress UspA family protein